MILVTGAAGHIGNVLIRELLSRGIKDIRALVLPNEDIGALAGLNIEVVSGNIVNYKSLTEAFRNITHVYHLAGLIVITHGQDRLMELVNVNGTKNIIRACLAHKVKRLLYTSSIHAIAIPPHGELITEKLPFKPAQKKSGYDNTKARATLAVLESVSQRGLDAVVVCPTGVIGPYDFRVSEMGELFIELTNHRLKAYTSGSYDFVDVRDVAQGMIAAMNQGLSGETYILSGHQISVAEIVSLVADITKMPPPRIKLPLWLALLSSYVMPFYYRLTNLKPLYTPYSIHTLASNSNTTHAKATRELGYQVRPIREAIRDSLNWFRRRGLISF